MEDSDLGWSKLTGCALITFGILVVARLDFSSHCHLLSHHLFFLFFTPQRVSSLVLHLHLTRVSSLGELLKVHQSRRLAVFLLQLRKRWREEEQQL